MKGYPAWFVRALLGALLLVFVSGCLLAPTTLVMRFEMALAWRLPGAGRVVTAAMHAATGFVLLMMLGALWSVHMRAGWRKRRQRGSGATLGIMLLLLAASAVAIYYAGEDALGSGAALVHLVVGLTLLLPFGWHWVHARRASRKAAVPREPAFAAVNTVSARAEAN
ncbi:hypothetical protein F2P44_08380 [Massilia sp. CCM 8695]|uniref:DUF4405 domain-containing protein n=1 Tax=Massilia frigida TaxID=2609281 RepID=A0ABX0N1W4_9BURK|nr:hypothetical protein [Massilia frigida]NHZ79291.1 hypothetical protein [Massilia frigida]